VLYFNYNGSSYLALSSTSSNMLLFIYNSTSRTFGYLNVAAIHGASSARFIETSNDDNAYLVLTFAASAPIVYSFTTFNNEFTQVQQLSQAGIASSCTLAVVEGQPCLVFAGGVPTAYWWNDTINEFAFLQVFSLPSQSSVCELFSSANSTYLLIGTGTWYVYQWDGATEQFASLNTTLPEDSAAAASRFYIGGMPYVALVQPMSGVVAVYQWAASGFTLFQSIPVVQPLASVVFTVATQAYLAVVRCLDSFNILNMFI
jgi:hypothetical protein